MAKADSVRASRWSCAHRRVINLREPEIIPLEATGVAISRRDGCGDVTAATWDAAVSSSFACDRALVGASSQLGALLCSAVTAVLWASKRARWMGLAATNCGPADSLFVQC
ncbi:hypothetical protein PHYPSEUDO_007650 [Phytophthora pseudosyringae]|uniref:Uncharacterized protein n=1 Tax=Phytophthora pseudosyringae TaxID=221518 RepID=A0A8T1VGY3_9STRA|nr:hypothetical protein PHYPSEUDO_007650 [Phytophthora pseudosyringae]